MSALAGKPYDVFISYSREDIDWVAGELYYRLRQARRPDGSALRIFFDADALDVGVAWRTTIAAAICDCCHFIPVYSRAYFDSDFCLWELDLAHGRDIRGAAGIVLPLKLDGVALPFTYAPIQCLMVAEADWFMHLVARMGCTSMPASLMPPPPNGSSDETASLQHRALLEDLRQLSQRNLSSFEIQIELDDNDRAAPRTTRDIKLLPRIAKSTRRVGDRLVLRISASQDCYGYVFDIGSSGLITLLFPNHFSADNRLRAGVPLSLPMPSDPYELVLSGMPGTEVIQIFALDRPIEALGGQGFPVSFEPLHGGTGHARHRVGCAGGLKQRDRTTRGVVAA
jgi:hypothetical protein